jgi:hypothetical protein
MTGKDKKTGHPRKHHLWTLDNWDDGYLRANKIAVYRPDYPRSNKEGYTTRAHAVWWIETGLVVPDGFVLHHINRNGSDDRIENLQLMTRVEHLRLHKNTESESPIHFICKWCGEDFYSKHKASKYCCKTCMWRAVNHNRKGKNEK